MQKTPPRKNSSKRKSRFGYVVLWCVLWILVADFIFPSHPAFPSTQLSPVIGPFFIIFGGAATAEIGVPCVVFWLVLAAIVFYKPPSPPREETGK